MPSIYTPQFGNNYCPQLRMDVSEQSSTHDTTTFAWSLYYVAHGYAASTGGVLKNYWVSFNGQVVKSGNFNINGHTSTVGITNGTFKVSRGKSAVGVPFGCSMDFNITWRGVYGGNKAANGSVTAQPKSSWRLTFNANGGTGAPGAMTKWINEILTIPSTKPTRTGYVFQGWGKNTSTVNYRPGDKYGEDVNQTLYAVWKAITYTVSYNANGGTGAPGAQTKTYGVTLALSGTRPTRTNYNFVGWGTSPSSTTAVYQPGSSYTNNSSITLYAIWSLAYTRPRITSIQTDRCTSNGTLSEEGTYALVKFNWATDKTVTGIDIEVLSTSIPAVSVSGSGTSGSVSQIIGNNSLSTESSYTISIHVSDSSGDEFINRTVPAMNYVMDFLAGGKGIAFGKPAEKVTVSDSVADFGEDVIIRPGKYIYHNYSDDPMAGTTISCCIQKTNRESYWRIVNPAASGLEAMCIPNGGFLPNGNAAMGSESMPLPISYVHKVYMMNRNSVAMEYYTNPPNPSRRGFIGYSSNNDTSYYIVNEHGPYVRIKPNILLDNNNYIYCMASTGFIGNVFGVSPNNNVTVGYSGINSPYNDLMLYGGSHITFRPSGNGINSCNIQMFCEQSGQYRAIFRPTSNGGAWIGTNTYRWNTAFFTNSITASDLKEKDVINDFDFKIDNFIMGLKPIAYRRVGKGDSGIRIHMGFGAQDVDKLVKYIGLGNMSITQASIAKKEEVTKLNDDGEEETVTEITEDPYDGTQDVDDKDLAWGLNYNEFIAPIVLMLQKQQNEIVELKRELYLLKKGI